jgi:MFS family permease
MMRRLTDACSQLALTAWVGALWAIGYIAAPLLFSQLSDRSVAGSLAGSMFSVVGWLGLGCGSYLLLFMLMRFGATAMKRPLFWLLLLMLGLSAAQLFGLQPLIAQLRSESVPRELAEAATRSRFATWHGVASVLYLVQSVIGVFAVLGAQRGLR